MMLIGTENLTVLSNISTSAYGIRSIIFLNDDQTMFVAFCDNNSLIFLNRTRLVPINDTDAFIQPTSCNCPHEILRMDDSFFYLTSYRNNMLYSFSATGKYTKWNEAFVLAIPN
jgi:hypothetical protein